MSSTRPKPKKRKHSPERNNNNNNNHNNQNQSENQDSHMESSNPPAQPLSIQKILANQLVMQEIRFERMRTNIFSQIQFGKGLLVLLRLDQQTDQLNLQQLKQLLALPLSGDELKKQVEIFKQSLENEWRRQRMNQVSREKFDLLLSHMLRDSLQNETLPPNLINAIYLYSRYLAEIKTAYLAREAEREKTQQAVTSLIVSDQRLHDIAQQSLDTAINQSIAILFKPDDEKTQQTQSQSRIIENLTVSLTKGLFNAEAKIFNQMASPFVINTQVDYSQGVLLRKMNAYFSSRGEQLIPTEGHCHGLGLCWLQMMDWILDNAFEWMRISIASCPLTQLEKIGDLIRFFLKLIDLGQNPWNYSNNNCTQQSLTDVMGHVTDAFSFTGIYSKEELEKELEARFNISKEPRITIQGFGIHKKTKKAVGHTVAVFTTENSTYKFFDADDTSWEKKQPMTSVAQVTNASWAQLFKAINVGNKTKFIVTAVQSKPKPSWLIQMASFFNKDKNLIERIIGAPVHEQKSKKLKLNN